MKDKIFVVGQLIWMTLLTVLVGALIGTVYERGLYPFQ